MNLVTNAFHAVEMNGGSITIDLQEIAIENDTSNNSDLYPERYAQLTCSDTGKGIDPAIISKVFDPYFTTKERGKGTGLGLSVVYGIVREQRGDIQIDSQLNYGTTVNVLLPIVEERPHTKSVMQDNPLQRGTEHILLVDDEQPILRMLSELLTRLGYTVTARTSSVEALEVFTRKPDDFALVLTDLAKKLREVLDPARKASP